MADPLAVFYTIPIAVRRKTGDGARGPVFAASVTLKCRLRNERKLIRTADGKEAISEAGASLPIGTPTIPLDSWVTLPDGRTALVLAESRHDSGLAYMPNYYSIDLT